MIGTGLDFGIEVSRRERAEKRPRGVGTAVQDAGAASGASVSGLPRSQALKGAGRLGMSALLFLTLPLAGQAQFNYTSDNGTVTITGYTGPGGAVTIPGTIAGMAVALIGDSAFSGAGLTEVGIPEGVTGIGDSAFSACWGLTSVSIPDSVASIGNHAFDHCLSLTAVTLGNRVTSIGESAFGWCRSLASVSLPDSVTSIGSMAFIQCGGLGSLTMGNSVTNIGADAFNGCASLTSLTLPGTLTSLGAHAFDGCSSLAAVYFQGNAPSTGAEAADVLAGGQGTTLYYLAGTTGWGPAFCGLPAVLWNPRMRTGMASLGCATEEFELTITGAPNIAVVVEASFDLANWSELAQLTLTGGTARWRDAQWADYPRRFYRLRSP